MLSILFPLKKEMTLLSKPDNTFRAKRNMYGWVPIVVVGVNNSFQRILLHKSTILVPTIVSDIKKLYQLRFWAIFERFLGDFAYFVIFQSI